MERVIEKFKNETGAARIISDHLIARATLEESFIDKLLNDKKNMTECLSYVTDQVKKDSNGRREVCIDDATVFGWSIHYFDEEILEDWKPSKARVITSKSKAVEENNDEESDDFVEEEFGKDARQKNAVSQKKPSAKKKKTITTEQLSLFDI